MTEPLQIRFAETDADALKAAQGRIAVLMDGEGKLDPTARKIDTAARKALSRLAGSRRWDKAEEGAVIAVDWPAGLGADAVLAVKLSRRSSAGAVRKAGAGLARARGEGALTVSLGKFPRGADLALGLSLRSYEFDAHRTGEKAGRGPVTVMADDAEALAREAAHGAAVAEGVYFARDLVNEPSNVLTTVDFAARLAAMQELGLEVTILEEDELEKLGMRLLLAVGQGSASPSKVVVMEWKGGGEAAPLALVGKGVVFDTGGISLKPAGGMEDMTMDMGGAGTVAGVMRTLALRRAKANVVGLVGLVENMPSGTATRPGDVVRSMKGDTVEIINTDAEGRLVLADVLWYAQERFRPSGIVDLATLTGAAIIALGHENAAVYSNDDGFCEGFLAAASAEEEGAWRMPLGKGYDEQLKSRIADMKNVGGRPAGSITAAQFLRRFVKADVPWVHLDIAGTASLKSDSTLAPKGATGWGVRALDRMIADRFEAKG